MSIILMSRVLRLILIRKGAVREYRWVLEHAWAYPKKCGKLGAVN
jgi:hypothetical protein